MANEFVKTMAALLDGTELSGTNTGDVTIATPANGLAVTGQELSLAAAIAGGASGALTGADKTKLDATTGTNSGDVTIGTGNGLSLAGQALSLAAAIAGGANGALTGADKTKLDAQSGTNSGDVTIAAAGATPNDNGASLAGQALTLQPADGTHPGILSILAQAIAGVKTFVDGIVAASIQSAADATNAVAAMIFKNTTVHSDAGDLEFDFQKSTGASLLKIDKDGNVTILGTVRSTAGDIGTAATSLSFTNSGGYLLFESSGRFACSVALTVDSPAGDLNLKTTATNKSTILLGNRNAADTGADVVVNSTATRSAGALLSIKNNTVEKAFHDCEGQLENTVAGMGVILKSPDGTRYRVTVANGGTIAVSAA